MRLKYYPDRLCFKVSVSFSPFFPILLQTKTAIYSSRVYCGRKLMADREGFEPSVPVCGTHTFQACSFDHSDTCPLEIVLDRKAEAE